MKPALRREVVCIPLSYGTKRYDSSDFFIYFVGKRLESAVNVPYGTT